MYKNKIEELYGKENSLYPRDSSQSRKECSRKDFVRMIDDCKQNKVDIVITKSLSRFGRDTIDTLEALKELREAKVCVIFENINVDTNNSLK